MINIVSMEGALITSTNNSKGKMQSLPPEQAILYWIPSMCVAIGMCITLLCSFWKFHKRKMVIRKLQMEYVEVNLAVKRPRIGAIRCNTHGAKWEDLMASLSSSGFLSLKPYLRPTSKLRSSLKHDILYEETKESIHQYDNYNFDNDEDTTKDGIKTLNPYYEQTGVVQSEYRPKKYGSKKKKKKMSRLNLYGVGYHSASKGDSVEISTISSPRRLPVMENHLWSGYSPNQYPNNYERQHPSIYYSTSYIESNETSPEQSPEAALPERRRHHKESKHAKRERHQEERVLWVLSTDIQQSSV